MLQGMLGKKIGMTQMFTDSGQVVPVTAILAGPCTVTQSQMVGYQGRHTAQIGFQECKRLNRPLAGHLKPTGRQFKHLRELPVTESEKIQVGQEVTADLFQEGEFVNITGTSKGRGFTGTIKRHGFSGGPKTHGQSDRWRAPGSIGAGTFPGRVLKGQKMAGRSGNDRVTVKNLKIIKVDTDRNLLFVRGAVPGASTGLLVILKTNRPAQSAV